MMTNAWIVIVPLTAGSLSAGIYFTVKPAVRAALREHDSQRRPSGIVTCVRGSEIVNTMVVLMLTVDAL